MDKYNHCFICHDTKIGVEKKDEYFNKYRESKHNLWNYVHYMLFLKLTPIEKLNPINTYTKQSIDENNIIFLPSCKDDFNNEKCNENEEKKNEDEEENDEIDENDDEYDDENEMSNNEKKDDFDNLLEEDEKKKDKKEEKKEQKK